MKLVVGLGNIGKEYENTRHNIGFIVLDHFLGDVKYKNKFNGNYYVYDGKEKTIFLKPHTFMNNSGNSVIEFVNYYNIKSEDIMIIHDDLDIECGKWKFKYSSSSGGHNGIKSIINNLGSKDFFRLKIGIKPVRDTDVIEYVTGKLSKLEMDKLDFDIFNNSILDFINYGYEYVMNKYNGK